MPDLPPDTIAILLGDCHLSHRPPAARSDEGDWYGAMERTWSEIKRMNKPVICAGDVFDRWQSPPELVNWAIRTLPHLYSVPGQHDLPYHGIESIKRSAYWTLVEAATITNLPDDVPFLNLPKLAIHAFPWNFPASARARVPDRINLAVIHRYCWIRGKGYPGAEKESLLKYLITSYGEMDVLHFGDNHQGFMVKDRTGVTIFNGGTLLRRKTDEAHYLPQIGLLQATGEVIPHYLDISADLLTIVDAVEGMEYRIESLEGFAERLKALGHDAIDFETTLLRAAATQSKAVQALMKDIVDAVR